MSSLLTIFRNVLVVLIWPLSAIRRWLSRRNAAPYIRLDLHGKLTLLPNAQPWWRQKISSRQGPSVDLRAIERLVQHVQNDAMRTGLVVQLSGLRAGWAALGALSRLLTRLRESGKDVVVFLPTGASEQELYVAAAASRVFLGAPGAVSLSGFSRELTYLRPMLDKIGVVAQVDAQGDYKSAAEPLVRAEMSAAQREQLHVLLTHRQSLLDAVIRRRLRDHESPTSLRAEVALSPRRAVATGLVDACCYEDGLPEALGLTTGPKVWALDARRYRSHWKRPLWRRVRALPKLVLLPIVGTIREQGGTPQGATLLNPTVAALRELRDDASVAGVILVVNSPGGSALVSDLIHHEVERLRQAKPVVAFFGDVAASGGYYIAAPCEHIVAAPEAVTGSIGVVSMKLSAAELLGKLGAAVERVETGPHATMMSPTREMSEAEVALLRQESTRIYERFLQVVSEGRKMGVEAVREVSGGRVWTAQDALTRGLVDELGDLNVAISALRARVDHPAAGKMRVSIHRPTAQGTLPPEGAPQAAVSALTHALLGGGFAQLADFATGPERQLCLWPAGCLDSNS